MKRLENSILYGAYQKTVHFLLPGTFWKGKFAISGLEHIPARGAAVIAANQSSHMDPFFLIAAIARPIHFVGLDDEALVPSFVRHTYGALGTIPVTQNVRVRGGKKFVRAVRETVDLGELIGIFPEGMLEYKEDRTGLNPFHEGVAHIARHYGVNVIPAYLQGTEAVFPRSSASIYQVPHALPVSLRIGAPIPHECVTDGASVREAIMQLREGKKLVAA